MAVSVPLIPQLFSANITTIRRFGEEAKDHISSISLNSWGLERWERTERIQSNGARQVGVRGFIHCIAHVALLNNLTGHSGALARHFFYFYKCYSGCAFQFLQVLHCTAETRPGPKLQFGRPRADSSRTLFCCCGGFNPSTGIIKPDQTSPNVPRH